MRCSERRSRAFLPLAGTASARSSSPSTRRGGPSSKHSSKGRSTTKGSCSSVGATSRSPSLRPGPSPPGLRPASGRRSIGAADDLDEDAFERKLYVIRRVAELAAGPDLVVPSLSCAHARLQGHADGAAARALLSRPRGRAGGERPRPRPLPLLDQHVPELGARPSLPGDRAQRRDQHAPRQQQLDARARVAARIRALRRRPRRRCCRSSVRAAPTRRPSTTCSSCSCSPDGRCRTR